MAARSHNFQRDVPRHTARLRRKQRRPQRPLRRTASARMRGRTAREPCCTTTAAAAAAAAGAGAGATAPGSAAVVSLEERIQTDFVLRNHAND